MKSIARFMTALLVGAVFISCAHKAVVTQDGFEGDLDRVEHFSEINACYRKERPKTKRQFMVTIDISETGSVTNVIVDSSDDSRLKSDLALQRCAKKKALKWKFQATGKRDLRSTVFVLTP